MSEEFRRVRPHAESAGREREKPEEGRAPFITGWQMAVCVIALAAAYLISLFGGGFYKTARVYVREALSSSITNEQVTEVFDTIRKQLPDASEVFDSAAPSSAGQSASSSASPGAARAASGASGASSAAGAAKKPQAGSSSASSPSSAPSGKAGRASSAASAAAQVPGDGSSGITA